MVDSARGQRSVNREPRIGRLAEISHSWWIYYSASHSAFRFAKIAKFGHSPSKTGGCVGARTIRLPTHDSEDGSRNGKAVT